jgi:hypothetical protein
MSQTPGASTAPSLVAASLVAAPHTLSTHVSPDGHSPFGPHGAPGAAFGP